MLVDRGTPHSASMGTLSGDEQAPHRYGGAASRCGRRDRRGGGPDGPRGGRIGGADRTGTRIGVRRGCSPPRSADRHCRSAGHRGRWRSAGVVSAGQPVVARAVRCRDDHRRRPPPDILGRIPARRPHRTVLLRAAVHGHTSLAAPAPGSFSRPRRRRSSRSPGRCRPTPARWSTGGAGPGRWSPQRSGWVRRRCATGLRSAASRGVGSRSARPTHRCCGSPSRWRTTRHVRGGAARRPAGRCPSWRVVEARRSGRSRKRITASRARTMRRRTVATVGIAIAGLAVVPLGFAVPLHVRHGRPSRSRSCRATCHGSVWSSTRSAGPFSTTTCDATLALAAEVAAGTVAEAGLRGVAGELERHRPARADDPGNADAATGSPTRPTPSGYRSSSARCSKAPARSDPQRRHRLAAGPTAAESGPRHVRQAPPGAVRRVHPAARSFARMIIEQGRPGPHRLRRRHDAGVMPGRHESSVT